MFVPDFARWPEFRSRLAAFTELLSEGIRFLRTIARALGWLGISRRPLHPAGDGSLGDVNAQQEKLAVNARRAPGWVLRHHTEDQLSHVRRQFFSTDPFSRL